MLTMNKPAVLVIDDTPSNLHTLCAALANEFDVRVALSGPEGLALAVAAPPDIILLDVMMPQMDGYEVCQRLKALPSLVHVPVVFVTALDDLSAEVRGLHLGASDYLSKPVNVDIARLRIRNLVEREQLRKEVDAQRDALTQHRDHLEAMVEARTADLSTAREAAEAASRAKSIFLSNISHELRTPMNAIMGMTAVAQRRTDDPALRGCLSHVDRAARDLLALLNNILDIANIEADRLTLAWVDFTFDEVLDTLRAQVQHPAAQKQLALHFEVAPTLAALPLRGDPVRLGQILLNLTGNAIKFTGAGQVVVRAALCTQNSDEVNVRFEVQDTGPGMTAAERDRLFVLFEQLDGSTTRSHGGTGLGLALSQRLARMMDGQIGASSTPGVGSTFWLTVRLTRAAKHTPPAPPNDPVDLAQVRLQADFGGARILLAGDEPLSQELSRVLLEDVGLVVAVAETRSEALAMAGRAGYDLILMDLHGSRMDGVDTATAIRALPEHRQTPILALTADTDLSDAEARRAAGVSAQIHKPVYPEQLYDAVVKLLAQSRPSASAS
ncbi:response regulator [Denitromonas halophila]|uniref:Virulence sensor protein BvgS n=1 Tax=Denitromonas halophila TaxID=1629404 RepID=A0A557QJW0_9RHOO|nr:response regulator [Denitromonas halophila]TVO53202.1 response regulator [Denitromonas halophila]